MKKIVLIGLLVVLCVSGIFMSYALFVSMGTKIIYKGTIRLERNEKYEIEVDKDSEIILDEDSVIICNTTSNGFSNLKTCTITGWNNGKTVIRIKKDYQLLIGDVIEYYDIIVYDTLTEANEIILRDIYNGYSEYFNVPIIVKDNNGNYNAVLSFGSKYEILINGRVYKDLSYIPGYEIKLECFDKSGLQNNHIVLNNSGQIEIKAAKPGIIKLSSELLGELKIEFTVIAPEPHISEEELLDAIEEATGKRYLFEDVTIDLTNTIGVIKLSGMRNMQELDDDFLSFAFPYLREIRIFCDTNNMNYYGEIEVPSQIEKISLYSGKEYSKSGNISKLKFILKGNKNKELAIDLNGTFYIYAPSECVSSETISQFSNFKSLEITSRYGSVVIDSQNDIKPIPVFADIKDLIINIASTYAGGIGENLDKEGIGMKIYAGDACADYKNGANSIDCVNVELNLNRNLTVMGGDGMKGENGIDGKNGDNNHYDGRDGGNGTDGGYGGNAINASTLILNVLSNCGVVIKGGNGGMGGEGGDGGDGRDCEMLPFWECKVGDGGDSGIGGNGGDSGYALIIEKEIIGIDCLFTEKSFLSGGNGGQRGNDGSRGIGGNCKYQFNNSNNGSFSDSSHINNGVQRGIRYCGVDYTTEEFENKFK